MAKHLSVGDVTTYHRVRVRIVDITDHPTNGETITVQATERTILSGADCGFRRWVMTRAHLEDSR